jgi:NADH dehydrogenase
VPEILIIGGGFGGVWSAASAVRLRDEAGVDPSDLTVMLVAPRDDMVIRPRLYEADPGEKRVPLAGILDPIGVRHVRETVIAIDADAHEVVHEDEAGRRTVATYDRLVIASGSQLRRPELPGAELLHDVDTMERAVALEEHLRGLARRPSADGRWTAVVVGSGFTGVEVATELVSRLHAVADAHAAGGDVEVVLVERADAVGPELGPGPRPEIEAALAQLGVQVRLGTTVTSLDASGVQLADGTAVPAQTVVWTGGLAASPLTQLVPGRRDASGRLAVDSALRVEGTVDVFAAGDTAAAPVEDGRVSVQSCQHAHAMGKHAGRNAAADLLGRELIAFTPDPYVTCLDLGAAGAVFTAGFDREVQSTGAPAKELKQLINRLIYPPTDDAAEILRAAGAAVSGAPGADDAATAQEQAVG